MVEPIDKSRVVHGRLIKVKNTNKPKFSNAKDDYLALWVEDADSKKERCLLFTERELKVAEDRANRNPEDLTKKSFLQDLID
jgi:hypothetical protein